MGNSLNGLLSKLQNGSGFINSESGKLGNIAKSNGLKDFQKILSSSNKFEIPNTTNSMQTPNINSLKNINNLDDVGSVVNDLDDVFNQ